MLYIIPILLLPSLILVIIYIQPLFLIKWLARRNPNVLYYVNTNSKIVALTIDDAPHPIVTPQILDVLKEHSSHATFFLIGEYIKGNEEILKRMRAEGHELANHLTKDYPSILLPSDEFENQLTEVDKLIQPSGTIKWLRPGSGWFNQRMLRQIEKHGYRCALASVYPHDTLIRNISIISSYIIRKIFSGAVIVVHDGKADRIRTVEVLKKCCLHFSIRDIISLHFLNWYQEIILTDRGKYSDGNEIVFKKNKRIIFATTCRRANGIYKKH